MVQQIECVGVDKYHVSTSENSSRMRNAGLEVFLEFEFEWPTLLLISLPTCYLCVKRQTNLFGLNERNIFLFNPNKNNKNMKKKEKKRKEEGER
jgi:hypothetical protein